MINVLYLASAVFIARTLCRADKINEANFQMKNNKLKNSNWQEANQLPIYKRGLGLEPGASSS